jgi:phage terminase large subunit GpA-like protein
MSSAQVGKTELLLNLLGYYMDFDPSPMLLLQPTLQMAEAFSKDRLAPMLRDTPALKGKVKDPRARDSGNTLLHKSFPGGHITMAGANSPASLASRPIRIFLADEVDRYPLSAGTEGDPLTLGAKRTATFWNRKKVYVSTPTVKGASRIELAFEQSDQRRYNVPCPHCDEYQSLKWANVKWPEDEPEKAYYACDHCGGVIEESHKLPMLKRGKWVAESESNGVAGFHLNELYSPWRRWGEVAEDFLSAKASHETLKTWVNTSLGETWEEQSEGVESHELLALREDYPAEVPDGVAVLVAGADIQQDRIELEVVGFGEGDESWSIEYQILPGDTTQPQVWEALRQALLTTYENDLGQRLSISAACIDSGYQTQFVYDFVNKMRHRHIYAVKGMSGGGIPIVEDQRKRLRKRRTNLADPQKIGVDQAKMLIYRNLQIREPGPGYCHFPADYDEEYFSQLTAERIVTKFSRGFARQEWVKTRPRNEALDCRVYAIAALKLSAPDVTKTAKQPSQQQRAQAASTMQRRRSSFLSGY